MRHGRFSLMDCLDEIDDSLSASNGILYDFRDVLVIAICASLCDMETCHDYMLWAQVHEPCLKRFLRLKNGMSVSAIFYRLFRALEGKPSKMEQRYYVGSRNLTPTDVAEAIRSHWGIENQLHWVLDVTMKEHASTVRKDNSPENLSLVKKVALNLLRMDTTDTVKSSLRLKRKCAAWDDELRARFMGLPPI